MFAIDFPSSFNLLFVAILIDKVILKIILKLRTTLISISRQFEGLPSSTISSPKEGF
jgi:hypothetical protein